MATRIDFNEFNDIASVSPHAQKLLDIAQNLYEENNNLKQKMREGPHAGHLIDDLLAKFHHSQK